MRLATALVVALLLAACGGGGDALPDTGMPETDAPMDVPPDTGPPVSCVADPSAFPSPVAGRCEATVVDPDATLPPGADGDDGHIVPGARRLSLVGETVEVGTFPMRILPVPGTRFAIVNDGGRNETFMNVVDLEALTVTDQRLYPRGAEDQAMFLGMALRSDGGRVWLGGGGSDRVRVYDLDQDAGTLTDAADVPVAVDRGYVSGVALLSDDRTLVVNLLFDHQLVVVDAEDGTEKGRLDFGAAAFPYDVVLTPDDATAFVSLWGQAAVVPVDLASVTARASVPVGKNPEGLTLSPDGTRLVVANSDSDSLTLVDVASETVADTLWLTAEDAPRGRGPSETAFGPDGRLYVVASGENAVDIYDDASGSLRLAGRVPTRWYPTDVEVLDDGTVLFLNGKDLGAGPNFAPADRDIDQLYVGSLTRVAAADLDADSLARMTLEVDANNDRASRFVEVSCPDGAEYDFPIPEPGAGPSRVIEHVVLLVRENKTYDAYLGALERDGAPHGNGDPDLTFVPVAETEQVFPNTLALAREFAIGDNYYSLAQQSIEGHFWVAHGRTTDFVERTWRTSTGRDYWTVPPVGVIPAGYPEEGSIFDHLVREGVDVVNYGEISSSRAVSPNPRYPGIVFNQDIADVVKAAYLAAEWRDRCRMPTFSFVGMPNDHTFGLKAGKPTPRAMLADNDAGIGMVIDAISHSEYWPTTVIFIVEDDPQAGGDHVDNHRSPLHVISPWVRRGHVSSVHYNESSLLRTIQLILGLPPLNDYWEKAAPMAEMFTSTPDFTPYDAIERRWPEETNPDSASELAAMSAAMDFSVPDMEPDLGRLLWRHLRGTEPPWAPRPAYEIRAELAEEAEEAEEAREAAGLDDDERPDRGEAAR